MSATYTYKYLQHELNKLDLDSGVIRNRFWSCGITAAILLAHRLYNIKSKNSVKMITYDSSFESLRTSKKLHALEVCTSSTSVQTDEPFYLTVEPFEERSNVQTTMHGVDLIALELLKMRLEDLLSLLTAKEITIDELNRKIRVLEENVSDMEMMLAKSTSSTQLSKCVEPFTSPDSDESYCMSIKEFFTLNDQLTKAKQVIKLRDSKISSLEEKLIMKEHRVRNLSMELASIKRTSKEMQDSHDSLQSQQVDLCGKLQSKDYEIAQLCDRLSHLQRLTEQQAEFFNKLAVAMDFNIDATVEILDNGTNVELKENLEHALVDHLNEKFRHLDELDTKLLYEIEDLKEQLQLKEQQFADKEIRFETKCQLLQLQFSQKEKDLQARMKLLQSREQEIDGKLNEVEQDMLLVQQWKDHLDQKEVSLEERIHFIEDQALEKRNQYEIRLKELQRNFDIKVESERLSWAEQYNQLQIEWGKKEFYWKEQFEQQQSLVAALKEQLCSVKLAKVQEVTDLHKVMHDLRKEILLVSPLPHSSANHKSMSLSSPITETPTVANREIVQLPDFGFKTPEKPSKASSRSSTPNKRKPNRTSISKEIDHSSPPPYVVPSSLELGKKMSRDISDPHDEVKMSPLSVADVLNSPSEFPSERYVRYYMNH